MIINEAVLSVFIKTACALHCDKIEPRLPMDLENWEGGFGKSKSLATVLVLWMPRLHEEAFQESWVLVESFLTRKEDGKRGSWTCNLIKARWHSAGRGWGFHTFQTRSEKNLAGKGISLFCA